MIPAAHVNRCGNNSCSSLNCCQIWNRTPQENVCSVCKKPLSMYTAYVTAGTSIVFSWMCLICVQWSWSNYFCMIVHCALFIIHVLCVKFKFTIVSYGSWRVVTKECWCCDGVLCHCQETLCLTYGWGAMILNWCCLSHSRRWAIQFDTVQILAVFYSWGSDSRLAAALQWWWPALAVVHWSMQLLYVWPG